MGVGGQLQPPYPRHQADGVTGEQRQVLGVQEERCAARRVGEQKVAAVQRRDGDLTGGQS